MKKITLLVSIFALFSCSTLHNYGTSKIEQLNKNEFKVAFQGRDNLDQGLTYDLALLRSAEVTLQKGFHYFSVVDSVSDAKFRGYSRISGYWTQTYGDITTVSPIYSYYSNPIPKVTNTILCYKTKPEMNNVYNAEDIIREIKNRYEIK